MERAAAPFNMSREVIERVVAGVDDKQAYRYASALWKAAREAHDRGELEVAAKMRAIADACSMLLHEDNVAEPFGPRAVYEEKSTAHPGGMTEETMSILREFTDRSVDSELRSRCADLLWVVKRDHKMALVAIEAYIESAQRLHDPVHWVGPMQRIERAYRLAAMLNHKESFQRVSGYAKDMVREFDGQDPKYFTSRLLELLAERNDGDAPTYAELAERSARQARSLGNHHKAQVMWSVAQTWRRLAKDGPASNAAELEGAREHVLLADRAKSEDDPLNESHHLSKAVTALKRARAPADEIEAVHKRLLVVQPEARKKMVAFGVTVRLDEYPAKARERVSGKSLLQALGALAFITNVPTIKEVEDEVRAELGRHPLMHLFHKSYLNDEGKVIAKAAGALPNADEEGDQEALRAAMAQKRAFRTGLNVVGIINPARETIFLEHPVTPRAFAPLVRAHPFIPPGHERAWARILHEGLAGDLETVAHYLGPQFEASIRFVLATNGAIVTGHNDEGIQEEIPLHRLLDMPKAAEIFGEDLVAEMKYVFVERYGPNLRNRVGHGLATDDELASSHTLHAWWLCLRLIMLVVKLATPEPEPVTIAPELPVREVAVPDSDDDKRDPDEAPPARV